MKLMVINGPNLNLLGKRDKSIYGEMTLAHIEAKILEKAKESSTDVIFFQSNHEGHIVDYIQENANECSGIIINPGALTHYGLSIRDALADAKLPTVEIHLSNRYAREEFRHESVIAPICNGQIGGLGWHGYILALEYLVDLVGSVN